MFLRNIRIVFHSSCSNLFHITWMPRFERPSKWHHIWMQRSDEGSICNGGCSTVMQVWKCRFSSACEWINGMDFHDFSVSVPQAQMSEPRLYLSHEFYMFCMYVVIHVWDFRDYHATTIDTPWNYEGCPLGFLRLLLLCPPSGFCVNIPFYKSHRPSCPVSCAGVLCPRRRLDPICPVADTVHYTYEPILDLNLFVYE